MSKKEELEQRRSNLSPAKRALLDKWKRGENKTAQSLISQRSDKRFAPLSFAQQRLWLIEEITPNTAAYNIPFAIRLIGQLNIKGLHNSLKEIVRRHEVLRTIFTTVNGEPIQEIIPELSLPLQNVNLQHLSESEREAEIFKAIATEVKQPFNLSIAPLLRVTLLHINEGEYVLLLVMHHIISDGWSMGVLVQELARLYSSSTLPPLLIQYADFAVWQRDWLQGDVLDRQLSYWKQQLAGSLPVLELPTDRLRPAVSTFQGSKYSFIIPQSVTSAIATLSGQSGVTLFMTLLAAFQTLLYYYTGQSDICVGTPIANRNRSEIEGLIGFFVNTLVLRSNLEGNSTFRELLLQVKEVTLGAYAHQDLPFEKLVEELQPERSLNHNPLFQVMFALQNAPMPEIKLSDLTLSSVNIESDTAQFDLSLTVVETEAELIASFEYNTDLFDADTITRMAGYFQTLLANIVEKPDVRLSNLSILTPLEREQLLVLGNQTENEILDLCIHQLFEKQVQLTPHAIAVVWENEEISYKELNQRANEVACYLQKLGVTPETVVGICVERSLLLVVGLLGILKAGGTYLPLDLNYPQQRLEFMLEDSQARLLLTQKVLLDQLPQHQAQVVCLDTDLEYFTPQSFGAIDISPVNSAYIIYTSGSTGKPKGVVIEHRNTVAFLDWVSKVFSSEDLAGVLASTSVCFDLSVFEIFAPLCLGGKVILAENALCLPHLSNAESVTLVNTVPSAIAELVRAISIPASVRIVNLAGEALSWKLVQQIYQQTHVQKVFNLYGPSEDTTYSTFTLIKPESSLVTIGRPINNTQIYVLNQHLQPVPIGVPGEIYIAGSGLARGYLNRPEITAERFISNPFSQNSGSRLYKTGDLARYRIDGDIEYLGRIDNQVKIRGFRIELGEIEAVLRQHPNVREAIAIAQTKDLGDKRLLAYIVPNGECIPTNNELRSFLAKQLPEYMLPQYIIILEKLPLTPNSKVDRLALTSHQFVIDRNIAQSPRDTIELRLTQIWEEILSIRPIGVEDNFFELGGHSLLAVRLITQINQHFGQKLPLGTIFEGATIARMANILRQQTDSGNNSPLVTIQIGGSQRPFFCVHPSGGNVLCYVDLARHLNQDQSFYGLQAVLGDSQSSNIIDMASRYIAAIRTIQPTGPYLLGGWSMGGIVAFEMAQQLQKQGEKVAKLILLDATAKTNKIASIVNNDLELLANFALDMGLELDNLNFSSDEFKQLTREEQLQTIWSLAKDANLLPPDIELTQVRELLEIFRFNVRAMSEYIPQPYSGQIILLTASETLTELEDNDSTMGWDQLAAGGVEIQTIPGDHYSIIKKPQVRLLAKHLSNHLN